MKKSLLLLVLASLSFSGFCVADGFKVTGAVEGADSGKVYILSVKGNVVDTLAQANIAFGAFTLEGKVDKLESGYLVIEGARGGLPIFLEPGAEEYVALLGQSSSITGGGDAQKLCSRFINNRMEASQQQQPLVQEFQTAQQSGDEAKMTEIRDRFEEISKGILDKDNELIRANPDSPVSLFFISNEMQNMDYETIAARFNLLGTSIKESEEGKAITEHLNRMKAVSIGQIAPDFTLGTPDGGTISLYGTPGKLKLIDFWASWCGPCRGENPNVVAIYNEYKDKGLEIIGVSLDNDRNAWLKAISDDGLIWKHGSDLKGWQCAPAQLYQVSGIPHTLLLDEDNRIIAKNLRGDALRAKIAEILK